MKFKKVVDVVNNIKKQVDPNAIISITLDDTNVYVTVSLRNSIKRFKDGTSDFRTLSVSSDEFDNDCKIIAKDIGLLIKSELQYED